MSGKKVFLYLFLIFAVILLIGQFLDSSKPANDLNTAECQELDRQMEALIKHHNAEGDAVDKRELRELENLERTNAPEAVRRRTITKHDIQDELRDDKQNNQYGALVQRMKEQGCLSQSPN
jgi:hypothetical protein